MKKVVLLAMALLILAITLLNLSSCECKHEWKPATCESPAVCKKCSAIGDAPLGHSWEAATCTSPKKCKVCGKTEGTVLRHSWEDATCASPKKCKICGATEGKKLKNHSLRQGYCSVCGNFVNELPEVVNRLKEYITDCNYNLMCCQQVLKVGGSLNDAVTYYNAYLKAIQKLSNICNKYPNEFVKFTNMITKIDNEQQKYINQFNASSSTSARRSALSSAASVYITKEVEINSILRDDYTKP
jgi:hypothetical protein